MRRKSIVAAAEKAFVNNTSGFFLRQEELGATRRGDTGFSKGPRLLPDTEETHTNTAQSGRDEKGKYKNH